MSISLPRLTQHHGNEVITRRAGAVSETRQGGTVDCVTLRGSDGSLGWRGVAWVLGGGEVVTYISYGSYSGEWRVGGD